SVWPWVWVGDGETGSLRRSCRLCPLVGCRSSISRRCRASAPSGVEATAQSSRTGGSLTDLLQWHDLSAAAEVKLAPCLESNGEALGEDLRNFRADLLGLPLGVLIQTVAQERQPGPEIAGQPQCCVRGLGKDGSGDLGGDAGLDHVEIAVPCLLSDSGGAHTCGECLLDSSHLPPVVQRLADLYQRTILG